MSNASTNLIVFVSGLAAGAVLGILFAPASGKETREKLMRKGEAMRDKVNEMVDEAKQMAGNATGRSQGQGQGQGSRTAASHG